MENLVVKSIMKMKMKKECEVGSVVRLMSFLVGADEDAGRVWRDEDGNEIKL